MKTTENCKNCANTLALEACFCLSCGAKIIHQRITIKQLFSNVLDAFGWDSNYIKTIRHLLYQPHVVCKAYIDGTRKRYANPFGLFLIISTLAVFNFSIHKEAYQKMALSSYGIPTEEQMQAQETNQETSEKAFDQIAFQKQWNDLVMEHQTLVGFLLLPFYAFIAFLVYRKPYNFGEHLIISTYLVCLSGLLSTIVMFCSLQLGYYSNSLFLSSMLFMFAYYLFCYSKLYAHGFKKALIKTFKFIGITIGLVVSIMVVFILVGFLYATLTN